MIISKLARYSQVFILSAILGISLLLRLYRWDRPLADWHSWRQADTASVTREYVDNGIFLLSPKYHDLSNIPSGKDNPEGYRMVEFPFVNATIAATYELTDGFGLPVHVFSRLWNILFSLGSIVFIFLLVRLLTTARTGLVTALIYGIMPFNLFFHTTVLPEVPLVFFSLGALYFWVRYVHNQRRLDLFFFALMTMLALLLKPLFIFFVPALMYLLIKQYGFTSMFRPPLWLAALVIIIPFGLWRYWIQQFPEGIPAASWLLNSDGIRFKGAWFRWLFADRFGRLILGYWGLIPFGIGVVLKPNQKSGWFFHWLLFGVLAYLSVFATGNVTHDYYQIFIVPILSIFVGIGIDYLLFQTPKIKVLEILETHNSTQLTESGVITETEIEDNIEITRGDFHPHLSTGLALVSLLLMLAFGWFAIRDNFNINNPAIVEAGQAVEELTPADAKIIAPYGGDTAFLYQTHRSGWPLGFEIEDKIEKGAQYYVSTSYDDEARDLEKRCQLVSKTDLYILIRLECSQI